MILHHVMGGGLPGWLARTLGLRVALLVSLLGAAISPTQAAVTVRLTEYTNGVEASMHGSADLTDMTYLYSSALDAPVGQVHPAVASLFASPAPQDPASTNIHLSYTFYDIYEVSATGDGAFGSGGLTTAYIPSLSVTGRVFGFEWSGVSPARLAVPKSANNDVNVATILWLPDTNFASLGIDLGSYRYAWGSGGSADDLKILARRRPVTRPIPGPLPLLGASAALIWSRRLRRQILQHQARS